MLPLFLAAVLSVGGSYPTRATLVPGRNTCGTVTVQDNLTTVAHTPGAATLSLSHAGNTFRGTVDSTGHFTTTPTTINAGSNRFVLTIDGRFSRTGLNALVEVDVSQSSNPRNCSYVVDWTATKTGEPNVLPGAPELLGDLPPPLPLFPANHVWNIDVRSAPVDGAATARLGDAVPHLAFAFPYAVAGAAQPLVDVALADSTTFHAPLPEEAKSDAAWIGGDGLLLVVDRDARVLYELTNARWSGRWEATSAAMFRLDANDSGLPALPGLLRYDELAFPIRHALRVTMRGLPIGTRLRLKASVAAQTLGDAMQTFGLIVGAEGDDFAISATTDPRFPRDGLNVALAMLRASDFEVLEAGWMPRQKNRVRAVRH